MPISRLSCLGVMMPYSNYAVSDRKAISQLRYQIRRFEKQMLACGTDKQDISRIGLALHEALIQASGSIDFHDDGSRMDLQCHY